MSISNKIQPVSTKIKMLLAAGELAGPLFTLIWIVEGAAHPGYNPLRHPVSSLALGDLGWIQIVNFIVAGLLMIAFTVGLGLALRSQRGSFWGSLLIGIWAIGLLGAGVFLTDPVSGYPPRTPDLLLNRTVHGNLHDLISLLGFLALTVSCFVFASYFATRGERRWTVYSIVTGILFPIGIFLASAAFGQNANLVAFGGLIQRLTVTTGWTWLTLLAIHVRRAIPERRMPVKDITNDN